MPIRALIERNTKVDWAAIDDVVYGCANQAGEDNRNVARMSLLLAGLPIEVPGSTVNRLCGSSMDAIAVAARAIKSGETFADDRRRRREHVARAVRDGQGGVRVFALGAGRGHDHRLALRQSADEGAKYGVDSMPETAENVAADFKVSRADQDKFALAPASRRRWRRQSPAAFFDAEIVPVTIHAKRATRSSWAADEHPRDTSLEALAKLKGRRQTRRHRHRRQRLRRQRRRLRAAAGERTARPARHGLEAARLASSRGGAAGVAPRIMGIGPGAGDAEVPAQAGLALGQIDVIELNEAFAAQALAVLRELGLPDDAAHVNPNGGAIALGHPLGASGARLVTTALYQLHRTGGRYALCTMCIGVGQGIAMIIERV